ncbi:MAG: O-antigen ligase family protein [Armatimonadota bacterium]
MQTETTTGNAEQISRPQAPRWLFWIGVAVVLVAPTQFAWSPDPKHGPFIAICDMLVALGIAAWVIWRVRRGLKGLTWPPAAVAGLLVLAVISTGMAESVKLSAFEIIQILLYFAFAYMFFIEAFRSRKRLVIALVAAVVPAVANIVIASVQYFTVSDPHDVGAMLTNRNVYSGFLVIALPVFFGVMLWHGQPWVRWVGGFVVAAGVLTMLSPPLVWIALMALLALAIYRRGAVGLQAGILIVALAVAVALVPRNHATAVAELFNPEETGPIYKTAQSIDGEETDRYIVKKRWLEWKPALNMLSENFVFGVGAGNFQLNIGRAQYYGFLPNVKKTEPDTNNLYLVIACTMGFPGLICLVAYLGRFWRESRTLWLRVENGWPRGLAMGLAASVVAMAIANIFTSLFVRGVGLIWALLFAIITLVGQGVLERSE